MTCHPFNSCQGRVKCILRFFSPAFFVGLEMQKRNWDDAWRPDAALDQAFREWISLQIESSYTFAFCHLLKKEHYSERENCWNICCTDNTKMYAKTLGINMQIRCAIFLDSGAAHPR